MVVALRYVDHLVPALEDEKASVLVLYAHSSLVRPISTLQISEEVRGRD